MYILKNQKGIKQLNYKLLWKENTIERVTKETKKNIDKSLRKNPQVFVQAELTSTNASK